ncbi:kinetochore protein NDC80 homolog [Neocloeon triangulifer]|uniref:kinetochore protein NDC80 homolog n=1 Tax=Neocloeon triangulifer TaxID=2078957 RepID=UPI00286F2466|nr:kinetochore protein NDC80 homolog [Neocloeon triangulifer]
MNRKSSVSLGNAGGGRRKSSLVSRMIGSQGSQECNEMPSAPRPPAASYSFMQNQNSNRQTLMLPEAMPSSSRSNRFGYNTESRSRKRSLSQEPPTLDKRRTFCVGGPDQHSKAAGLLLTPVRTNIAKSPGYSGLSSVNRSASSRRNSSKLHIISDAGQKLKDPRPISDKNFQANAISKIQNFLRRSNPALANIKLKPLSNSTLVQVFNAIYKELDPITQVTNSDYADKISNIMKNLGYPSNISKSSFVAVGSGHGGVQILAMLSWLVDCVEFTMTVDFEKTSFPVDTVDQKTHKALCGTILRWYNHVKSGEPDLEQTEVNDVLMCEMGESPEEQLQLDDMINTIQQEIKNLMEDPRKIEDDEKVQQIDIIEGRINKYKEEIEGYLISCGTLKAKINTEKETIRSLEGDNNRYQDMCSEISDRVERQPMRHTDRDKIVQECKEIKLEIETKNEHLAMVHRIIGTSDLKITKLQSDIRSIIHEINEIVLGHQLAEQYKWTHNPTHADAKEQMALSKSYWSKGIEGMEFNNDRDTSCILKLVKDIEELSETGESQKEELQKILNDCDQLDSKIIESQSFSRMSEQELNEKIEIVRAICFQKVKEKEKMPKLDDVEQMTSKVGSEKQKAQADFRSRREFVEGYFFPAFQKMQAEFAEELWRDGVKPFEEITTKFEK